LMLFFTSFIIYMSQAIKGIRHFRKCLDNWGNPGID
jgi:hypothetical protein